MRDIVYLLGACPKVSRPKVLPSKICRKGRQLARPLPCPKPRRPTILDKWPRIDSVVADENKVADLYAEIEPLTTFQWQTTTPEILHPYHAPYNLALGKTAHVFRSDARELTHSTYLAMQEISTSELIVMDNTYLNNITVRKELIQRYPDLVIGANPDSHAAVKEIYTWFTGTYLPTRFPTMFELVDEPKGILNRVDGQVYPSEPPESAETALGHLGSMMDEDLLFLLPANDGGGYILSAFVNCFANGPHTRQRLQKNVRAIHAPIPGYEDELASRVDQWFDTLSAGKIVKRTNWAITDDNRMFVPEGHFPFSDVSEANPNIDCSKLYVRSERQTLRRLQQSGAIVFSLRTYIYPLKTIKDAGYGPMLVQAIDGLDRGNGPCISEYKQASMWQKQVTTFLEANESRI
ncbi:hypothetical protein O1611_g5299 [Lasiodiplodia mahajangana]|uniref:Uncharacterized protein n=1 Tax=Lasiodiplodia mahajangana TaxID=1108764 RepID=A0ACC2JLK5_9PEZI|nr:hypothetical protein O1611_g5299 [Lasiodiplodia mahajangana]